MLVGHQIYSLAHLSLNAVLFQLSILTMLLWRFSLLRQYEHLSWNQNKNMLNWGFDLYSLSVLIICFSKGKTDYLHLNGLGQMKCVLFQFYFYYYCCFFEVCNLLWSFLPIVSLIKSIRLSPPHSKKNSSLSFTQLQLGDCKIWHEGELDLETSFKENLLYCNFFRAHTVILNTVCLLRSNRKLTWNPQSLER